MPMKKVEKIMIPFRNKSVNDRSFKTMEGIQPETRGSKHGIRNTQHASRDSKPATRTPDRATRNAQRETRTPYATIRNPKSEIRNRRTGNANRGNWWCINLGIIDYREAWNLQTDIVEARNNGILDAETILMLEHPAVFTLGRRGGAENLLVSESFLKKSGIAVTQVERGGNITYHGPGQLVVYPIVDLATAKVSVVEFVEALEEVMLRTVEAWGIKAERNPVNRGIWVNDKKLGSIGIALRKGVSFHGLALNVNLDLTPFSWIQPCGLQGVYMTSMKQELSAEVSMPDVRKVLKEKFESVLGVQFIDKNWSELMGNLKSQKNEQTTMRV
jgi:lipoate-protein ligase B